jgi:hypothetical protein
MPKDKKKPSKKLKIDGPAGRFEVTDKYLANYDRIFRPEKKENK